MFFSGGAKMELDAKKTAAVFKAFCDENRIQILQLLCSGEKCACKLLEALPVTQPTLSHHMKILCDSGIVIARKDGKWMHYSISPDGREYALQCLKSLTNVKEETRTQSCCEK
jgi:ArsR family transcriptional regulator